LLELSKYREFKTELNIVRLKIQTQNKKKKINKNKINNLVNGLIHN